ncbi:metal transporter Nramp7.2-like isoform X2 [Magnolia sinica]|uniref:metal transporter Nramp7.2-like isoform X2 n=1 Tax=Magnolia sinica TaxID=86752 RepID=UPI002659938B|nr:metal transporter Nramp7.2-like isoform X2 [Magnolia sinica]
MSLLQIEETSGWKKIMGFVGPGFLVSVAYLDPGNLETDLQAGAAHKYELLWIVLLGSSFSLMIQSRAANLGVATVIGTAFALNILFKIPIWGGVLLAGLNTLLLLALQRYGIRKLEIVIAVLMSVMGGCFFAEMARARPDPAQIMEGMFVPRLKGHEATRDAIALLGALIMPHNLFLHSALVLSRKFPRSFHGINTASRYFLIESGIAIFIAFLINVAVISVSGSICSDVSLSSSNKERCENITLNSAAFLLKKILGNWSSKVYAVSLLASGQSSTVTGTYAGQFIMQGFLDLKMKSWLRNLITRCIAIIPSLVATLISGPSGAGRLIIIASMILSFELPFALIPLLKFTSSKIKMGHHQNSLPVMTISWALGFSMIGVNMYFLNTMFVGWFVHNHLWKAGSILVVIVVFPCMVLYVGMLVYLMFRKETNVALSTPLEMDMVSPNQAQLEKGAHVNGPKVQELEAHIVREVDHPKITIQG